MITPESLTDNDTKVKYYTGLPSYKNLKGVFNFVHPCIKNYSWTLLPLFLMVLVWLRVKVTATCSWIKFLLQTCLYNISYQIFTTTSRYSGHSAIVQHNTNFVTVHSQVTVGGCSVEYKYKLLRLFTTTVGELGAIYEFNRARATHCRATQSVSALILEYNTAAVIERLQDFVTRIHMHVHVVPYACSSMCM